MGLDRDAADGLVRIGIVDDHPVTRHGLAALLGAVPTIAVVSVVADPAELPTPIDVVLLDLYLNGDMPSLDVVADLARRTNVLVMSASRRRGDVLGAVRAGASGYLTKRSSLELIVSAVESVAAGGFALSPQLADLLQSDLASGTPTPDRAVLAPREEETLGLIARGLTHAQAARRMGVSKTTVDTYVGRIRTKLRVGNKAELTKLALDRQHGRPAPSGEPR